MAVRSASAVALATYRKELGLSARAAALELRVTHAAVRGWERGRSVPGAPYREAIERWSGGRVAASGWGLSRPELRAQKQLAEVEERPAPTGTDS